jgi:Fe-S-cluster-containing dehydrogenase component/DMSO reductase anchor subunit
MTAVELISSIDALLAQQADRTAIERFADWHDEQCSKSTSSYRALIPIERPRDGEQYAFEVDLDACSGCKACVTACQHLNGLDPDESFRRTGLLHGTGYLQTITTACHHCVEPACLSGCPVDAYEKDERTGIVRHLDDQCIGCSYCTLTCPYEVPRFNRRLGIVRKCDLCADRLFAGEPPACAQACPNDAIRVTAVSIRSSVDIARRPGSTLVPGAPPSALTAPTTRYRTRKAMPPDTVAADLHTVSPAHGHPPLSWMLVITQLAVGAFVLDPSARLVATGAGLLALGGSLLHLGRPLMAWRAVLGLRHSWLSREIVAFGLFAILALASVVVPTSPTSPLHLSAIVAGVAGIWCSTMVYAVTGRPLWALQLTAPRFALTTALLGSAATLAPAWVITSLAVAKLAVDGCVIWPLARTSTALSRTAHLLRHELRALVRARLALACAGVLFASAATFATVWGLLAAAVLTAGELVERHLFFRSESSHRMPGGIA